MVANASTVGNAEGSIIAIIMTAHIKKTMPKSKVDHAEAAEGGIHISAICVSVM